MAKKELTVAERLRNLYKLQLVDSELDQIAILKGELPIEVSDLEDDIVGLETRKNRLGKNIEDIEAEINRHKGNIKDSESLIEKYERQLDNVKNNREYEALMKEQELQRLEIQLSEKKIRESEQNLAKKQEFFEETQLKYDAKQKDLEVKKVELAKIIEKTEKVERKLERASTRERKKIPERLLQSYLKVRESFRNGLAVVTVERDSCGGCFNRIPPQVQLEIGLRKNIIVCEHCGRILVDDHILEEDAPVAEESK